MTGSILILAGRRPGTVDALAAAHGVADKCLVPIAGRPMIAHVLAGAAASGAGRIFVSTHHEALADDIDDPAVAALGDRRSEERRVGKEHVRPCRSRWRPAH